jgi:hypothetical protein
MQLELFPMLPVLLRPPRRLCRLGFELEQLRRDIAILLDCRRGLDQIETELAEIVTEAKAVGHVIPRAYRLVVQSEELREKADEKLRDCDELYRALERQLDRGINNYLTRRTRKPKG